MTALTGIRSLFRSISLDNTCAVDTGRLSPFPVSSATYVVALRARSNLAEQAGNSIPYSLYLRFHQSLGSIFIPRLMPLAQNFFASVDAGDFAHFAGAVGAGAQIEQANPSNRHPNRRWGTRGGFRGEVTHVDEP